MRLRKLWHCVFGDVNMTQRTDTNPILCVCIFTKLREGNVYSCVSLSTGMGSLYKTPAPNPCTGTSRHSTPLYPIPTPTPEQVQTCSPWSTDCQQAGGWQSTEMPSCRASADVNAVCEWALTTALRGFTFLHGLVPRYSRLPKETVMDEITRDHG